MIFCIIHDATCDDDDIVLLQNLTDLEQVVANWSLEHTRVRWLVDPAEVLPGCPLPFWVANVENPDGGPMPGNEPLYVYARSITIGEVVPLGR